MITLLAWVYSHREILPSPRDGKISDGQCKGIASSNNFKCSISDFRVHWPYPISLSLLVRKLFVCSRSANESLVGHVVMLIFHNMSGIRSSPMSLSAHDMPSVPSDVDDVLP
jgi:hypothetical protein